MCESDIRLYSNLRQYNAATGLLDRHVQNGDGSRIALLSAQRADGITYSELLQDANRLSNRLRDLGVEPGQRVTLLLPDSPEFVYAFFASLKTGAIAVPLNTFSTPELLEHFLIDSRAVLLLAHSCYRELVEHLARDNLPQLQVIYLDEDSWRDQSAHFENHLTDADDSAFWLYTSGSTGQPKAVMHRHGAVPYCASSFGSDVLELSAEDRCFSTSKLFFAYGLGNSLLLPLAAGASVVLNPKRCDSATVCELVRSFEPTLFFSVPTLYSRFLSEGELDAELLAPVRICVSAGEYLPYQLLFQWVQATGQMIYDGIGTTEAMHIFCANRPGHCQPGTSGQAVAGYELQIVDDHGLPVPQGEIGELLVRGETLAKGYWNRDTATRRTFADSWLRTGDLYYQDDRGYFAYAGRRDDSFKSAGLWVSSVEIEQALLAQQEVREAVVLAAANKDGLVGPMAFVKLERELPVDEQRSLVPQLMSRVSARLAKHKVPHAIEVVSDLPRTATGKVARQALRPQAEVRTEGVALS